MALELKQELQTADQSGLYVETSTTGTWSELDLVEDVNFNEDHDKKEIKPRRSTRKGVKANLIGLNDFSGSLKMYVPEPTATGDMVLAYQTIRDAAANRKPVKLLHTNGGRIDSTTAIPAKVAVCGVGVNRSETGDDPTQETYNFHYVPNNFQDAPQTGTVSGGSFTAAE